MVVLAVGYSFYLVVVIRWSRFVGSPSIKFDTIYLQRKLVHNMPTLLCFVAPPAKPKSNAIYSIKPINTPICCVGWYNVVIAKCQPISKFICKRNFSQDQSA